MVKTRILSGKFSDHLLLSVSRFSLISIAILVLSNCSAVAIKYPFQMPAIDSSNPDNRVWPAPPEVPRYAFIGHLYGESDTTKVDQNESLMSRFFAALVGLDEEKNSLINLMQPQQVSTDNNGRIYVADTGRQAIFVFDEITGDLFIWNESSLNVPFLSPIGVANVENSIWVTDSRLSLVYQLNYNGEVINTVGKGVLERPTGITYDPESDRIFISDTADNNIKVFNTKGELIDVWGHRGLDNGELNHPTFITYRQNKLYVADSLNARIQIFDDLGQYINTFGQRGLYVGNFSRPKGVALDSDGNIYVSESYYDHLLIYNERGELLMSIGGSGINPGQFSQPTGLWVDNNDRIFVSDMLNGRVSVFQYLGRN
jgi:DNA-binding beta-propeller fold protein YncE